MKYILISFFLIALNCNQPKKETIKTEKPVIKEIIVVEEKKEVLEKPTIKIHEELVVVLKNPKNVIDARALIENSSLIWEELIIDYTTLKAASIKVPVDKKDFWIDRLKSSNVFSSVEIKSAEAITSIKYIAENTFVKISKGHCSGDCAVYDVILFKDGKIIYNGIDNVAIKGKQEFVISDDKLENIKSMFQKTTFGTYLDSYVDKSLMDYPSTYITHKNKLIEIKLWKNVPKELALAYEAFEDVLFEKKLIE